MIIATIIPMILMLVAGTANAIMDKISFHHGKSVFAGLSSWWNPKESWRFKWKNGDNKQGERFWLSSTLLVWVTDAWHFFKSIMKYSYIASMTIMGVYGFVWTWWIDLPILIAINLSTFHMLFTYAFTQKIKKET